MKSFLRFVSRNRLYTVIEVAGMAIALAFIIFIGTYVTQERSYDTFVGDDVYVGSDAEFFPQDHGLPPAGNLHPYARQFPVRLADCRSHCHTSDLQYTGRWLQTYSYRIDNHWWMYLLALLIVGVVATLSISYRAVQLMNTNPALALRKD